MIILKLMWARNGSIAVIIIKTGDQILNMHAISDLILIYEALLKPN